MNDLINLRDVTSVDDLPLTLTVTDIQNILGVCRRNAYQLCTSKKIAHKRIGSRIIISKYAFIEWLQKVNN